MVVYYFVSGQLQLTKCQYLNVIIVNISIHVTTSYICTLTYLRTCMCTSLAESN